MMDMIGWVVGPVGLAFGVVGVWLTVLYGQKTKELLEEIRDALGRLGR
jgi:hypothetical protein